MEDLKGSYYCRQEVTCLSITLLSSSSSSYRVALIMANFSEEEYFWIGQLEEALPLILILCQREGALFRKTTKSTFWPVLLASCYASSPGWFLWMHSLWIDIKKILKNYIAKFQNPLPDSLYLLKGYMAGKRGRKREREPMFLLLSPNEIPLISVRTIRHSMSGGKDFSFAVGTSVLPSWHGTGIAKIP